MKRLIAFAAMLLAGTVWAEHVYDELAKDNPDLKRHEAVEVTPAGRAGEVTEAEVYEEVGERNPDLPPDIETSKPPTEEDPSIYKEVQPNPDLKY
jgi:hypothetical protein